MRKSTKFMILSAAVVVLFGMFSFMLGWEQEHGVLLGFIFYLNACTFSFVYYGINVDNDK